MNLSPFLDLDFFQKLALTEKTLSQSKGRKPEFEAQRKLSPSE